MRDATLSSHQHALTTQEIAHREAYPHVREARANIASRRVAAPQPNTGGSSKECQRRVTTAPSPSGKYDPTQPRNKRRVRGLAAPPDSRHVTVAGVAGPTPNRAPRSARQRE
ncbi:thioesterase [Pseudoscourfieldia marina]